MELRVRNDLRCIRTGDSAFVDVLPADVGVGIPVRIRVCVRIRISVRVAPQGGDASCRKRKAAFGPHSFLCLSWGPTTVVTVLIVVT